MKRQKDIRKGSQDDFAMRFGKIIFESLEKYTTIFYPRKQIKIVPLSTYFYSCTPQKLARHSALCIHVLIGCMLGRHRHQQHVLSKPGKPKPLNPKPLNTEPLNLNPRTLKNPNFLSTGIWRFADKACPVQATSQAAVGGGTCRPCDRTIAASGWE